MSRRRSEGTVILVRLSHHLQCSLNSPIVPVCPSSQSRTGANSQKEPCKLLFPSTLSSRYLLNPQHSNHILPSLYDAGNFEICDQDQAALPRKQPPNRQGVFWKQAYPRHRTNHAAIGSRVLCKSRRAAWGETHHCLVMVTASPCRPLLGTQAV